MSLRTRLDRLEGGHANRQLRLRDRTEKMAGLEKAVRLDHAICHWERDGVPPPDQDRVRRLITAFSSRRDELEVAGLLADKLTQALTPRFLR